MLSGIYMYWNQLNDVINVTINFKFLHNQETEN